MRTKAENHVGAVARELVEQGGYGVVAIVATYREPGSGERDRRLANAILMSGPEAALDAVMLIRRLRTLADELEATVRGQRPLPPQDGT